MSLFQNLLRLYPNFGVRTPTEDFFTEVVAHLLQSRPALTLDWLKQLRIADGEYASMRVKTQATFASAQEGEPSNRLDILIELETDQGALDWVIIESKIDAPEGTDQLRRYASILANRDDLRRRSLVYITKDHDPKDGAALLGDSYAAIVFRQTRWHEFYHLVKRQPHDGMIEEVVRFMEDLGMAMDNVFSPAAIGTMVNLRSTLALMDSVLAGEVPDRMKSLFGKADFSLRTRIGYLEDWNHYWVMAEASDQFVAFAGFYLATEPQNGYPSLMVRLQVGPKSPKRLAIVAAMQQIEKERSEWSGIRLNETRAWTLLSRSQNLSLVLASGDHVAASKAFLLDALDDVAQFQQQFPDLSWKG